MNREPTSTSMASIDLERQQQTPHRDGDCSVVGFLIRFLVLVALAACIMGLAFYLGENKHYSVSIDSATVLDSGKTLGVSFNLTLGVASWSHGSKACIDPGMYVEVLYHGVQVAVTDAIEPTCARPRQLAEVPIMAMARPTGQQVDLGAVFDLKLHVPDESYSKYRRESCRESRFWDCKGSRVGEAAVPCGDQHYTRLCTVSDSG